MRHYIKHLFTDPLGFMDQLVRDTLIAASLVVLIISIAFLFWGWEGFKEGFKK